jgi:hypothetical protein
LSRLRLLRGRRASFVPLRSDWRWYQRWLARRLFADWRESYVLLENGDYFHLPAVLERHGEILLTEAVSCPDILAKFCRPEAP